MDGCFLGVLSLGARHRHLHHSYPYFQCTKMSTYALQWDIRKALIWFCSHLSSVSAYSHWQLGRLTYCNSSIKENEIPGAGFRVDRACRYYSDA